MMMRKYDETHNYSFHENTIQCRHCRRVVCATEEFIGMYMMTVAWTADQRELWLGDGMGWPVEASVFRRFLYRKFLETVDWAPLRQGVRNRLPHCALMMIRRLYPSETGAYTGFHASNSADAVRAVDEDENQLPNLVWTRQEDGSWLLTDDPEDEETV